MPVYTGDQLTGKISWFAADLNCDGHTPGYDIYSIDNTDGLQERLTLCTDTFGTQADAGALEVYGVSSCTNLPYTYYDTFSSIVSTPSETSWSGAVTPGLTPSCSYWVSTSSNNVVLYWFSGSSGGGGGGSLAAGTLITMADHSLKPVQNINIGDKLIGYDTSRSSYTVSNVTSMKTVTTNNQLVINTETGTTLRTDRSPTEVMWTKLSNGTSTWLPVTDLTIGDFLFTQNGWVKVTSIEYIPYGTYTMYDITATFPYFANGYLDPPYPS